MDSSYEDEFVRSYPGNPNFRGYTKDNCKLLEQQNMYKQLYMTALRSMIEEYLKVDIVLPWNTCPYGIQTPPPTI